MKRSVAIHPNSNEIYYDKGKGKPVDNYGFIVNHVSNEDTIQPRDDRLWRFTFFGARGRISEKRSARRQLKWNGMLHEWDKFKSKRFKKLQSRIRKGIPNSIRAEAWKTVSNVTEKRKNNAGIYQALLLKSNCHTEKNRYEADLGEDCTKASANGRERIDSYVFEVIERDLSRTFPLHYLFCRSDSNLSGSQSNNSSHSLNSTDAPQEVDIVVNDEIISKHLPSPEKHRNSPPEPHPTHLDYAHQLSHNTEPKAMADPHDRNCNQRTELFMEAIGGKASLRRVLRAYSIYDREVGYCQGMNFIAAMFLTYLSEEDSFWMMVYVMNDQPCRMRGLFGEDMSETQCILFVAEKLFAKFLPRLSSHFQIENVHITMFATQWLLTLYSSSFPFELVTRVWDIFLLDGWKIVYRVMIALLDNASSKLVKLHFEDILNHIKEITKGVNADKIIRRALKIPIKRIHLQEYTEEWLSTNKARK